MQNIGFEKQDLHWCAALCLPLAARCVQEGYDLALKRLSLLAAVFVTVYLCSTLLSRRPGPARLGKQLHFSLLFALFIFNVDGWIAPLFAAGFGWLFAYEMFGGKPVLSPVVVALAVAIFSFPDTGFQETWILNSPPGLHMALACALAGLWLAWRKLLDLPVVAGVTLGVAAAVEMLPPSVLWWEHLLIGAFLPAVVFVASDRRFAPTGVTAQVVYGALLGLLVITLRLASPDQPDGVVFAVLLASLFAPLLGRALAWRPGHG